LGCTAGRGTRHPRRFALSLVSLSLVSLALVGCASAPPPRGDLDAADAALRQARELKADALAPVELEFAERKRAEADAAMEKRNFSRAQQLAAEAAADAALAAAKSRAASGRAEVQRKADENAKLRRELLNEGTLR